MLNRAPGKISVVMTVLNEGGSIDKVIESLMNQTRLPDEIVVCDGGSSDDTAARLDKMAAGGAPLKVVIAKGACRGAGRNRAIEAASHPYIALTDAGNFAAENWLELLASPPAADGGIEIVYGTVMPIIDNRFDACLAALTIGSSHVNGRLSPSAASLLFTKRLWQDVGGFPEGLTTVEDLIFIERLKNSGAGSATVPEALVSWSLPTTFTGVYRRSKGYSRGSLTAGYGTLWHRGTLRNLAVYAATAAVGLFVYPALVVLPALPHMLRVHRYLSRMPWFRHRGAADAALNYLTAGALLAVLDAATLHGLYLWVFKDGCRRKEIGGLTSRGAANPDDARNANEPKNGGWKLE